MKSTVKSVPKIKTTHAAVDRRLALLLVAFALGWYARTLPPGLLAGDPGEFQFAAWRFGLAHPTGYPLYLIVGGIWQHILAIFGVDPAYSLNLLSTLFGALTVGLLYLFMARNLPSTPWGRLSGLFAALLFALNPTFWSQSIIAEVYTLNALLIVAVLWAAAGVGTLSADDGSSATTISPRRDPAGHFPAHPIPLFLLLGFAVGHHRTALFLLPGLLLWLFWIDRGWWRRRKLVISAGLALVAAQVVYAYIPLRSGPDASPWLYPRLDGAVLALYQQSVAGFVDFITGRVFAVSFLGMDSALARLPQMAELWLLHFNWTGLALILIGLVALLRARSWSILLLTVPLALILQLFNLFYGIGDIYVFYIPLYLVGAIWAGFGVAQLGQIMPMPARPTGSGAADTAAGGGAKQPQIRNSQLATQFVLFIALLYFVIFPLTQFYEDVDLSGNDAARSQWNAILAANPPAEALLVSNDRNEIVPLYYLQAVEGRAPQMTGIFPLLTAEERFANVAGVVQTALDAGDRPVYLIKPMDGLGVRFDLEPATAPLVRVLGAVHAPASSRVAQTAYGPLTLLGVELQTTENATDVILSWRVDAPLDGDYTTTVQLFDADNNRIAQSDQPPGFPYYPTSLWKVGDRLREQHRVSLTAGAEPTRILIAMYRRPPAGDEWIYLGPPLELALTN